MEQGTPPRGGLVAAHRPRVMTFPCGLLWLGLAFGSLVVHSAWAKDEPSMAEASTAAEKAEEATAEAGETPPEPEADPLSGGSLAGPHSSEQAAPSPEESVHKKLPPLTPDIANLNLPEDLELVTLDTQEKVFLPAGTYRQILRIPIDSPTMQSAQTVRRERRPEVKVPDPLPPGQGPEKKPLWIRYESLEKIKINDEERRGGLDVPIHGSPDLKPRLWYAKSETADVASSVFYFIFGGFGYGIANAAGWSAGNTRTIPSDFEYRLIRR